MNKLKKLQAQLTAGTITEANYKAAIKDLLDDEDLSQEEYDTATEFDGEEADEKLIYSQADMDQSIVKKSRQLLRKELKTAGVDVSDIKPQDLLSRIAELAAAGTGKAAETDADLKELRKKAAQYDEMAPANKKLIVENAVLKMSSTQKAINPAQVVRALNADYADLLDYDEETGALDPKSVATALKRIAAAEPNLFEVPEGGNQDEDLDKQGANFAGKPPGGAGAGSSQQTKAEAAHAKSLAAAKEMLGLSATK